MRVLRLENSAGDGPYVGMQKKVGIEKASRILTEILGETLETERRPKSLHDTSLYSHMRARPSEDWDQWFFGFKDRRQMNRWFSKKERQQLSVFGFSEHEYDVPENDVLVGDKQLVFRKDRAIAKKLALAA